MYYILVALIILVPGVASAQTGTLQNIFSSVGVFLNDVVLPLILAIAFIVFITNVVRFFIIGGSNEDGRENAKNLAIYGIGAFVLIVAFWGIVTFFTNTFGFNFHTCNDSDYIVRDAPCTSPRPEPRPAAPAPAAISPLPGNQQ